MKHLIDIVKENVVVAWPVYILAKVLKDKYGIKKGEPVNVEVLTPQGSQTRASLGFVRGGDFGIYTEYSNEFDEDEIIDTDTIFNLNHKNGTKFTKNKPLYVDNIYFVTDIEYVNDDLILLIADKQ